MIALSVCPLFFFNDTATTEIYTLSLHDALPILVVLGMTAAINRPAEFKVHMNGRLMRSEEHTSELQSLTNLVCRLLLEKKKNKIIVQNIMNVAEVVLVPASHISNSHPPSGSRRV